MPLIIRVASIACMVLLCACSTKPQWQLPTPKNLTCCWQSYESVLVYTEKVQEPLALSSVVLVQENQLQLIIMDVLGQKLASIKQQGHAFERWQRPGIEQDLPLELLLLSVYLSHMDKALWPQLDTVWTVEQESNVLQKLYYRGRLMLSLGSIIDGDEISRQLQFADADMRMVIKTLVKTDLRIRQ